MSLFSEALKKQMDISMSHDQVFLKKYLHEFNLVKTIDTFDNWVDHILPKQVTKRTLEFQYDGKEYRVRFNNVSIDKPQTPGTDKTQAPIQLTPNMARLKDDSYQSRIYADIHIEERDPKTGEYKPVHEDKPFYRDYLGMIPIMIKSKKCHLQGKSESELIQMEECPNDAGGYFIVKGSERVIMTEESLRLGKTIIFPSSDRKVHTNKAKEKQEKESKESRGKNVLETRFTYNSLDGTSVVKLYTTKKDILSVSFEVKAQVNGARCRANFTTDVFEMFHLLAPHRFDKENSQLFFKQITDYLFRFVVDDEHVRENMMYKITPSLASFYISPPTPVPSALDSYETVLHGFFTNCNGIHESMKSSDPYLQCDNDYKLASFASMVARTLEYLVGYRELDDRDSWSNKRVETAGRRLEELFSGVYDVGIECAKRDIKETKIQKAEIDKVVAGALDTIRKNINDQISTSMTSIWGVKTFGARSKAGSYNKGNVTESLKRQTPMEVYSQVSRLTIPTRHSSGNSKLRMVQQTQLGYICVAETPEGDTCGISKNLSCTAKPSIDKGGVAVYRKNIQLVHEDLVKKNNGKQVEKPRPIFVNGVCVAFSDVSVIKHAMTQLKRQSYASSDVDISDTCIVEEGNNLFIYCDGGRPVRPLFVVEDGELIMDKLNLWDADMNTVLSSGAIEYIDAWEQEYIMLAPSVDDVVKRTMYSKQWKSLTDTLFGFSSVPVSEEMKAGLLKLLKIHSIRSYSTDANEDTRLGAKEFLEFGIRTETITPKQKEILSSMIGRVPSDVCDAVEKLKIALAKYPDTPYTHSELSPLALLGVVGACNPAVNYNQAPRNTYQCKMAQQALSGYHTRVDMRFDTSFKVLNAPRRPMFDTMLNSLVGMDKMPAGWTPLVAIMAVADNQEDAFIAKKEAIDRGMFHMTKYITKVVKCQMDTHFQEHFKMPTYKSEDKNEQWKYRWIRDDDEDKSFAGMPKIGAHLKKDQCIVGKVIRKKDPITDEIVEENTSIFVKLDEEGIVDRVLKVSERCFLIKIRIPREPVVGDKFASRYAQKGTISRISPASQLPTIASGPMAGCVPDLIINSHALPSRMTIGKAIEFVANKSAMITCKRVNATAFTSFDMDSYFSTLKENGFNEHGYEKMYDGKTGREIESLIYCGPCYYQALRHNVLDKIQARGFGRHRRDNFQPVPGRSNEGGLRVGEMERDAFISHGASAFLHERLCGVSDQWEAIVCKQCGMFLSGNANNKYYICNKCVSYKLNAKGKEEKHNLGDNGSTDHVGVMVIPYVWKVLVQLLAMAGMNLTVTTEVSRLGDKTKQMVSKSDSDAFGSEENQMELDASEYDRRDEDEDDEQNKMYGDEDDENDDDDDDDEISPQNEY